MKNWKDKIAPLVFLAPWIVGFLILTLLPMAMSLYFSFTNYNLLTPPKFIGLSNYVKMFTTDLHFMNALKVTFIYVLVSVPLQLMVSLALAIVLNKGVPGIVLFQSLFLCTISFGRKCRNLHFMEADIWYAGTA